MADSTAAADSRATPARAAAKDDDRLDFRDPVLAALLAWLVPGAGHLYQGRTLKAALYAVCVLGLFGWGMGIADGKCVSFRPPTGPNAGNRKEFIHYLGQVGAGLVALPAVVQYRRYYSPANQQAMSQPLDAAFDGVYEPVRGDDDVAVAGQLTLEATGGRFGRLSGQFVGQDATGEPITLEIGDVIQIDAPIGSGRRREVVSAVMDGSRQVGTLFGSVPRSLADRFEVPLSREAERDVNALYGTRFDLAAVITMIAGLLNFLAVYDAFDGPAYGYDAGSRPEDESPADGEPTAAGSTGEAP